MFNDNSPEFLICELRNGQLRLLFAAVYRRPHALSTSLTVSLITSPTFLPSSPVILNMAFPNSPDAIHLQTSICSNSLRLVPSDPTHHQVWRGSHTWIDFFIVKSDDSVLTYSKSDAPFIAGHDFI